MEPGRDITCATAQWHDILSPMYSQRDEEKYILDACKDSARRRVLDIGAWDPKCFSNSRALIEQGWGAVLIEPSPGPLRNLVKEYGHLPNPKVDVVSAAVCVSAEPLIELAITDDAVSGEVGSAQTAKWAQAGNFIGRLWVPTLTLPEIIDRFGAFDCVSIDTEGSSVDLLKILVKTEMFPKCIVVEHDGRIVEAMQAARARAYHSVYESEENLVLSL